MNLRKKCDKLIEKQKKGWNSKPANDVGFIELFPYHQLVIFVVERIAIVEHSE